MTLRPTIRLATSADAARLSSFAIETFRDTYAEHNSPANLTRYIADAFTVEKQTAEIAHANGAVLLAEHVDDAGTVQLVGYAHLVNGPAPPPVVGPAPIELRRFYVGRRWHGQGVGKALMDGTLEDARSRDAGTIWLGVWEHNPRAIAFYTKSGFGRVGDQAFLLGDDVQHDWLLARRLETPH